MWENIFGGFISNISWSQLIFVLSDFWTLMSKDHCCGIIYSFEVIWWWTIYLSLLQWVPLTFYEKMSSWAHRLCLWVFGNTWSVWSGGFRRHFWTHSHRILSPWLVSCFEWGSGTLQLEDQGGIRWQSCRRGPTLFPFVFVGGGADCAPVAFL